MRVIVADDEFFARKALVKRIGELSEEIEVCEEAENGRQVMELLKSHGADLVVTDIRMPDMDGLEVAKQVKEQFPETSVIIESGYADFDYATTAIRYGVKDYLTKPVKKEELERAVQRVKEEKKTLNQKLEKQLAVYKGQLMDFSRILENETAAREILGDLPLEILSMKQAGISADIEEDGTSFEENALIKAREVCRLAGEMVLADDSGLEIDYLNGEPGIYSARYMGEDTSYRIKNQNLIDRLEGVPDEQRTARFVCAIAAVFPNGKELVVRGTVEGMIGYEERGENGFGYDPIFYLPDRGVSTAELPPEEKNSLSHRGNALRKMKELLEKEHLL